MKKVFFAFKLSLLEFRIRPVVFINVLLILVIGNLAPILVSSLKTSTDKFLQNRSREILSADLSVSGIKSFTPEQKTKLLAQIAPLRTASEIQFLTMVRSEKESMLVEVKGVDENYPLFGAIHLLDSAGTANAKVLTKSQIAWIQPEIIEGLGIQIGELIHIGQSAFRVQALVNKDSVLPQSSLSFAPRIYIGENFVSDTKLDQYGSQIFYRIFYQLKSSVNPEILGGEIKKAFNDANLFIRSPHDAIEGFSRFLNFFSRYLSIMTLVIFSIAWVSAFYIYQSLNQSHLKQAAIIITFGGSRLIIAVIYLLQSFLLSIFSFSVAVAICFIVLKFLRMKFIGQLPEGFDFQIYTTDFLKIFSVSVLTSLCFVLTLILKISRLNIQILLGESNESTEQMPWRDLLIMNLFVLTLIISLTYFLIGAQSMAFIFVLSLVFSSFVSLHFGRAIFALFRKFMSARPGILRLLSVNLSRVRFAQSLCFVAIALIAIVLNIVPHLMSSLKQDIDPVGGHQLPALFLFNIPEERLDELKKFLAEEKMELAFLSPLILARITAINAKPPAQDFFLKYPVRISYRKELISSEKLVEGEPLPVQYLAGSPIYLSLDQGFAERYDLHIGDEIQFDVAGIAIMAKVRNLRRVRWSDFNPNFYFEFQVGVLVDSPKTWLANLQLSGNENLRVFQNKLIKSFPDISVIDIRKSIETISQLMTALKLPAEVISALSGAMSLLILGLVIWHHLLSRTEEIEIVKILSPHPAKVFRLFVSEYMALAFCALFVGSVSGLGIATYVCHRFLKIEAVYAWSEMLYSSVAFLSVLHLICYFLVSRIMRRAHTGSLNF